MQADYSLKTEGTVNIPASCRSTHIECRVRDVDNRLGNTTNFTSLHLTSSNFPPYSIYGTASTGSCSTIFSTTVPGFFTVRSKEFAGDIRSLAWSPNGKHLHALDSHSSSSSVTSIFNFFMASEPTLNDQNATDILANTTSAEQMVTHPTGNLMYVVTRDTNELVTIPMLEGVGSGAKTPSRYKVLPSSLDATQYTTSTLAISSSKASLWTLSQSTAQAVITVFSLNATTGEVIGAVARAAWSGMGSIGTGQIAAAPFEGNDMIAVANSPIGMVAFLGLDKTATVAGQQGDVKVQGDDFLEDVWMLNVKRDAAAAPKLKSFGRIDLGLDGLGEGVWVD